MRRLILWGLGFISSSTPTLPPSPISPRSRHTSIPALLLPQFRFSLILLSGPLTGGVGSVVSCCQFDPSVLFSPLPSLLILGVTFYSLEECSTDKGYMLPDPIVWDFGSLIQTHRISKEVRGIQVAESLAPKRLNDFHPKVFHCRYQSAIISLIIAVTYVLQGASVLYDCTPV